MIRKKLVLHRWFYVSGAVLVLALTFGSGVSSAELSDAEKDAIGRSVTNLFKATRKVISQSQKLINDKNSGEKGLTGDAVIEKAWKNYKESFKDDLGDLSSHPLKEKVLKSFEAATREVMTNAQPLINKRGLGFKRFLPAIFARHVSDSFNRIMDGKAQIKLTAPRNYIRNRTNRPDNWESNVIENFFKKIIIPKINLLQKKARIKVNLHLDLSFQNIILYPALNVMGNLRELLMSQVVKKKAENWVN